jgi:succinylarginine dihydrolase
LAIQTIFVSTLPRWEFADEGAANHVRLALSHASPGIECFVYGRDAARHAKQVSQRFPARQTSEASQCIARQHQLSPSSTFFIQQNPEAIDAGVFHNDVIAVGNENVLLCHELAFVNQAETVVELIRQFALQNKQPLHVVQISTADLSLEKAVKSYLFNSQLVTRPDGKMSLICPVECDEMDAAKLCLQTIVAGDNPIDQIEYVNLRQSMQNGGGPACLRLRIVLTEAEQARYIGSRLP